MYFQFSGTVASPQTAGASDYNAVYSSYWVYGVHAVYFAPGQGQAAVSVQPWLDDRLEGDETVELALVPWPHGSGGYVPGTSATATLTIHDAPVITVTADDAAAREGKWDEPDDPGAYTLTRAGRLDLPLTVRYRLSGSAGLGSDYALFDADSGEPLGPLAYDAPSGQLLGEVPFAAGQTTARVRLRAKLDLSGESVETALFSVFESAEYGGSGGHAYAVGQPSEATVSIADVPVSYDQWAYGVDSVSSEWEGLPYEWRAVRALGTPDTLSYGDLETAWSPQDRESGLQTIVLTFAQPARAGGLLVRETSGNGFVTAFAFAERVNGELVWRDGWQEIRPDPSGGSGGSGGEYYDYDSSPRGAPAEFIRVLPYLTDYPVAAVSITVNTDLAVDEWEEIDAVRLLFSAPPEMAESPRTEDDTATMVEDGEPVIIDVLANDTHPHPVYLSITSQPAHGYAYVDDNDTPLLLGDDFLVYLPGQDYNGNDSFTYDLQDIFGFSTTALVTVTVVPVNDAPGRSDYLVAVDDEATLVIDMLPDTDIDGDPLNLILQRYGWLVV